MHRAHTVDIDSPREYTDTSSDSGIGSVGSCAEHQIKKVTLFARKKAYLAPRVLTLSQTACRAMLVQRYKFTLGAAVHLEACRRYRVNEQVVVLMG